MRIHINASGMGVKMDDVETLFFLHVAQLKTFDSLSGIVCLQNRIAKQSAEEINSQTISIS